MNTGRWERVQLLFERALEIPLGSRESFLRESCVEDPALAEEIASLLAAHDRSGDLASVPSVWLGALSASDPSRFAPGERVADRYEIRALLGRGGMGEVYEAWDSGLSIDVALKALRIASGTEDSYRRLKMEGFLARSVWHPNVCRVYDLARHEDEGGTTWFLTMERLRGDTLAARLRDRGKMPPEEARPLAEQIARALDAAHAAGVVHRDLKPGNVMLVHRDGEEQAVVTDFGISRSESEIDSSKPDPVRGPVVGTPAYMAPEQWLGEPGGPAADIYALGVVLYEMVTGTVPFPHATQDSMRRGLSQSPRSLSEIAPDVDERWERAILRCLERDPRARWRRASDVSLALAGQSPPAPVDRALEPETRHTLPPERDDFVGRAEEVDTLHRALSGDTRLLTLVGAAGMGKTRLGVHYAWTSLGAWPGGVWFCDLKDARDVLSIASAVARALGVPLGRLDPVEQLGQAIAARETCLLILDNFDPVIEHAEATLSCWLERARHARYLATSRERLYLDREHVQTVDALPDDAALELFTVRARRLRPGLELDAARAAAAREIVRLVDGMPLAIELAAARTRVMDVPQILDQMRDRFRLLTGGRTSRHETLEIAIGGSWESLTPWEKTAWVQCSVFEDGFTLEAAERVVDLGVLPEAPPVVDVLMSLADRSLVRLAGSFRVGSEPRLGMYVSLKEYARRRLDEFRSERGVQPSVAAETRHGVWYSRFGTDASIDALDRAGGVELRRVLEREISNLMAACRRARDREDTAIAVATYRAAVEVLALRGPYAPGIEMGVALLELGTQRAEELIWVLYALARMERLAGHKESARSHSLEALTLARESSDRRLVALLVGWFGNVEYDEGSTESARSHYEDALAMNQALDEHGMAGVVLGHLGILDYMQGSYESAESRYLSALDLLRRSGDRRREGYVHGYLGTLHRNRGRFPEALAEHAQALAIHREVGDRSYECQAIGNLGNLHVEMGRAEEATRCYQSAVAMARELGDRRNEGLFLSNLGSLHLQEERLEDARTCFERALAHHRQVGTRPQEGYARGLLARLSHHEGKLEEARAELDLAEGIMREVSHHLELAKLLCLRGQLEIDSSNVPAATAALEEVETLASARGWGSEGELGAMIAKLRVALRD